MPEKTCSTFVHPSSGRIARRQTYLALATLTGLLAIAIGLLGTQSRFNPAVFAYLEGAAERARGSAARPVAAEPIIPLPEGVSALTPPERFEPESLSDKIDGKAELYLSAGFIRLDCQRFALAGQTDLWIEVFIYDMGSPENAYAVFSTQRRADGIRIDLAEFAYRAENAFFFVHGHFYLELIASDADERLATSMIALARAFITGRPVAQAAITERDLFPKQGLMETGLTLIPSDAFGFAGLDRVFAAPYTLEGREMTAFLSRRANPQEAAALATAYVDFLRTYGGEVQAVTDPIPGAVVAVLDMYEVVFAQGSFLAGVHEAPDRDQALVLAAELAARLKEASGAR
jgi:hypothetical protein